MFYFITIVARRIWSILALGYGSCTVGPFTVLKQTHWQMRAVKINKKNKQNKIYIYTASVHRHPLYSHSLTKSRWLASTRMSYLSIAILFTATIWLGRLSLLFPLCFHCVSLCLSLPLLLSPFLVPLWHFGAAPVIMPALHAPRVQLALQTPRSQHTMHNPAPRPHSTLRRFPLH